MAPLQVAVDVKGGPVAKKRNAVEMKHASKYEAVSLLDESMVVREDEVREVVVELGDARDKKVVEVEEGVSASPSKQQIAKTSYVPASTVAFWLGMWFIQNIGVTFWNKKALNALRLPVTLTFVHMVCNTLGAFMYIHIYKGIERKPLKPGQQSLMVYFSLIFVSNIITGNWSLGLVSITFNQIMRALVPGVVVGLSMLILGKTYSTERKAALLPVAYGVYLTCSGDNSCTFFGFLITVVAVIFAGLKAVLSSKFLTGDLKLHPVDLILHQAPLSAMWCLMAMLMTGEWQVLMRHWYDLPHLCVWYFITGVVSFLLNVTSFYANKVTSPVTLCVCGNVKQIMVISLSILINHDVITTQKMIGIMLVTIGGIVYAYISTKEMNKIAVPAPRAQAI
ncbi:hypothetical protein Poli38472_011580 [Pythium oligandrum]|uniref:Sugar phosphate transporter domain-containing protein n=1 Tax=Pythium oligandrum TaxID=41045 RepID=A0A8K1CL76_PYTOL|nr:hypothetical protein Poli38472_011580 [Pythium oligandrum]|eukprot:TMW64700.1 hypothetical protein Poli38472_011580 [Pythium oligandrum]